MKCYLCGKKQLKVVRNKVRYDIPREVLECQNCGLNYLNPVQKDLKKYYSEEYRKKYSHIIGKTFECEEIFNLMLPFQQAHIEELKKILNKNMKALDIGCSTGQFLYALKNYVNECVGIEFNFDDAKFTEEKLGIKVYTVSIEETDIPAKYFDLITMYQVLEHIDDPINFLKTYRKYLKPTGYLCVEVPNINDILISGYNIQSYMDFWFREPHLFNFSEKTLKMVLEKAGFKGEIKGIQRYNLLNHFNWIFIGKPQKNVDMGMSKPFLIKNGLLSEKIKYEINRWFEKVDEEYKDILVKNKISDSILFIGQKS